MIKNMAIKFYPNENKNKIDHQIFSNINLKYVLILFLFFLLNNKILTVNAMDSTRIKTPNFIEKITNVEMSVNKAEGKISSNLQIGMKTKLQLKLNTFLTYFKEYSKINVNYETLQDIKIKAKINVDEMTANRDSLFGYYNPSTNVIQFTQNKNIDKNQILAAHGIYDRTRYKTGWDKLNIKTYSDVNPLIQCWTAGFIEGVLSQQEIYFYHQNIRVFFESEQGVMEEIKNFYAQVDQNLKKKISTENFENLKTSKDENAPQQWAYITCLHAQMDGLFNGYNKIADEDKQLTILDFYLLNSEGNFGDLKTFMKVNKMKISDMGEFYTNENLKRIYDTDNVLKIWKSLMRNGHCSALVKLVETKDGKFDMIGGHNTWTEYCEMLRTLKLMEWGFEGSNQIVGMKPKTLNYSSYPGILFSGDDFYELDSKVVVLQTTLSSINKFIYKDAINVDQYIPEYMRLMIVNFTSDTALEWVTNYKSFKNHLYITQWIVLDYNVLEKINEDRTKGNKFLKKLNKDKYHGLVYLLEEVPGSILFEDITDMLLKNSYFGSFNLAYFHQHQKILGLKDIENIDFTDKQYNPRFYILQNLQKDVNNLEDFANLLQYNGYNQPNKNLLDDPSLRDPSNGISSRSDLYYADIFHGGVDFKIVTRDLVQQTSIYTYGGPSYGRNPNLLPFDFAKMKNNPNDMYHQGIPQIWNFSPFFFSKKEFK